MSIICSVNRVLSQARAKVRPQKILITNVLYLTYRWWFGGNATCGQCAQYSRVVAVTKSLIQHRLHEGQRICGVQVTKDQLGSKGGRLTTNISLPSRYLVYPPSQRSYRVSRSVLMAKKNVLVSRLNLRAWCKRSTYKVAWLRVPPLSAYRLINSKKIFTIYWSSWRTICARREETKPNQSSELIYQELSLPLCSILWLGACRYRKWRLITRKYYEQVRYFAKEFVPFVYDRIADHTAEPSLFDVHRVEDDFAWCLKRRVDLKLAVTWLSIKPKPWPPSMSILALLLVGAR